MGRYEDTNLSPDGTGWGKYLRIKVQLDNMKPLLRVMKVNIRGRQSSSNIKKLPYICFSCGCIGHRERDCEEKYQFDEFSAESPKYGNWLRASPEKKNKTRPGQSCQNKMVNQTGTKFFKNFPD